MLVSYKWLQDYVDIPWTPEELADRLTMAGLEVEGLKPLAPDLDGVFVGYVEETVPHPEADRLTVCTVDVGEKGGYSIVCGAPNVAAGQTVAVALPGAVLPGGMEIATVELRGVVSQGMICSESELGISEDHAGIWVLPSDLKVGEPLVTALDLDDVILDVSVYANRPDCMSMIGIAREVAALTGGSLRLPSVTYEVLPVSLTEKTSITVESPELCPRYTAALLDGIEIGPSPIWMQMRLRAAGMRPINNVVDITNYVMLETGQPLHAFDYDQLAENRLVVRTAKPKEAIVTLDGEKRELTEDMLLICDAQGPKCIAGIMGGLDSEVTERTKTVLLETANFAAWSVRRTSRTLGLSSESSARFEKGIDPYGTLFASERAAHLLQQLAKAEVYSGHIDVSALAEKDVVIDLRLEQVERLLGITVPVQEIERILTVLGFGVVKAEETVWQVRVPTHRGDVELEADLIEEIIRIWGLDKLPSELPADTAQSGGQSVRQDVMDSLREKLMGVGLSEALSYSFGRADNNDRLLRPSEPMLQLQNPISEDLVAMRHSLLPGLLNAVGLNASRQQARVALFELGAVYFGELPLKEQPREEFHLGIVLWGQRHPLNWALEQAEFDFYDLKGILEAILPACVELRWGKGSNPSLHPGRQGTVEYQGREIAYYGEVHPAVVRNFRIPGRVYAAEIKLEDCLDLFRTVPAFSELPKYPAVERDLAVVVDEKQPVGELISSLQELGGELLRSVTVFDVYAGGSIPAGKKSVALSCRFQADRTLVDEEVKEIMDRCLAGLESRFGARIR